MESERQIERIIAALDLRPHPEGGWYRQTYISNSMLELPDGDVGDRRRPYSTSIYFLVTRSAFSAFHRLRSDELWYHHAGDALAIEMIHPDGRQEQSIIGPVEDGCEPQTRVPAGVWFASRLVPPGSWALCGCAVAPGFDFRDFELAEREKLIGRYPEHRSLIVELTRTGAASG